MFKRTDRRCFAFTLIEIMLVVIIIGTLAAVMVPRFAGKRQKAQIAKAKTEIASLGAALDAFEIDTGKFPSQDEGLDALLQRPASLAPEIEWDGPYMREVTFDPWGSEYQYQYPGEFAVDYDLLSFGPDMQEGTEDDLMNVQNRGGQRR